MASRNTHARVSMDRFKRLNPAQVPTTAFCMLVGKRRSGKTTLMKNLAYHLFADPRLDGEEIHMAVVFSPTEGMQHSFETFVPKCFIYSEYREEIIIQLLETQRQLIEKNGHTKTILIILDDLGFDAKLFKSKTFRELAMNGRHCKIFVMCAVHYIIDVPTSIRGNIDLTFAMADNSGMNRERLWSNLFSQVPKAEFNGIFAKLTANRSAIVCLNDNNSSKIEETVFWYRADPDSCPQRFMLGLPIFWKMNDYCSGGDGSLPAGYAGKPLPLPPPPPPSAPQNALARPRPSSPTAANAGATSPRSTGQGLSSSTGLAGMPSRTPRTVSPSQAKAASVGARQVVSW